MGLVQGPTSIVCAMVSQSGKWTATLVKMEINYQSTPIFLQKKESTLIFVRWTKDLGRRDEPWTGSKHALDVRSREILISYALA